MTENVKFTEEELNSLKEIQNKYLEIQDKFGNITISRINLKIQADELSRVEEETKGEFLDYQTKEKELVDEITKKYGQGQLDPQTGVFTPAEKK